MAIRLSCHCGGIALTVDEDPTEAIECNCSMCRRRGSILAATTGEKIRLETPREAMATYTFNKHVIRHHFCPMCGCAPFAEGEVNGQAMAMMNLRCAEDFDLSKLKIIPFDGASRP